MPDSRKSRGPHPTDEHLFSVDQLAQLREATSDLVWLFNRGYAANSSLKIVGDRYALTARQRSAVARCACDDPSADRRQLHELQAKDLCGKSLWLDGYNVLTSVEAALSGGLILHARDGCFRDLASMHGNYRKVQQTLPALGLIGQFTHRTATTGCHWLLDRPVSNSGRLKQIILDVGQQHSWNWSVELVPDPDAELKKINQIVASSDSEILNHADQWFNLARAVIESSVPDAWVIDFVH